VGLFAQKATYPIVGRPQLVHDRDAGTAGGRFSLKLKYPTPVPNAYAASGEAHELDLLFGRGSPATNGQGHAFFFRDTAEMALLTRLKPASLQTLGVVLNPRNWSALGRVLKRLKAHVDYSKSVEGRSSGWAGIHYFSMGPFALGDGAMKLCLRPRQTHPITPVDGKTGEPTKAAREALQAWIAAGQDAVFDLGVQLATPACIPAPTPGGPSKSVMAAE
jgi:hypothetical protein